MMEFLSAIILCVSLIILSAVPTRQNSVCIYTWTYNTQDRLCYKAADTPASYTAAVSACQDRDAILAAPKSRESNSFIQSLMHNYTSIWVPVTDKITEGEWRWEEGDAASSSETWTNWGPGQPDQNTNYNCAYMSEANGRWYNYRCSYNLSYYVCSKAPSIDGQVPEAPSLPETENHLVVELVLALEYDSSLDSVLRSAVEDVMQQQLKDEHFVTRVVAAETTAGADQTTVVSVHVYYLMSSHTTGFMSRITSKVIVATITIEGSRNVKVLKVTIVTEEKSSDISPGSDSHVVVIATTSCVTVVVLTVAAVVMCVICNNKKSRAVSKQRDNPIYHHPVVIDHSLTEGNHSYVNISGHRREEGHGHLQDIHWSRPEAISVDITNRRHSEETTWSASAEPKPDYDYPLSESNIGSNETATHPYGNVQSLRSRLYDDSTQNNNENHIANIYEYVIEYDDVNPNPQIQSNTSTHISDIDTHHYVNHRSVNSMR